MKPILRLIFSPVLYPIAYVKNLRKKHHQMGEELLFSRTIREKAYEEFLGLIKPGTTMTFIIGKYYKNKILSSSEVQHMLNVKNKTNKD
jgi:hypothetical protein